MCIEDSHPIEPSHIDPSTQPYLSPPTGSATVEVSYIVTSHLECFRSWFVQDPNDPPGRRVRIPATSWFIKHVDENGKVESVLWDLGLRTDLENATPRVVNKLYQSFTPIPPLASPSTVLTPTDLSSLQFIILSHYHFDHTGNPTEFPSSVPLVVGPGFKEFIKDGWEPGMSEDEDHCIPKEFLSGRKVVELGKDKGWTESGADMITCWEKGVDWFGDGSLWILDAPGHCVGHLVALARVTANPSTYILLCGDAAHDRSLITTLLPSSPLDRPKIGIVEGSSMQEDHAVAYQNFARMARVEKEEEGFVVLAHDRCIEDVMPPYPATVNNWKKEGWKEKLDGLVGKV